MPDSGDTTDKTKTLVSGVTSLLRARWAICYIVLELTALRLGLIYFTSCKFFRSLVGFCSGASKLETPFPNLAGYDKSPHGGSLCGEKRGSGVLCSPVGFTGFVHAC